MEDFDPHDLRRTCITDLLEKGANIVAVKNLAGHESVQTTAAYDRSDEKAKRKAAELLRVPQAHFGPIKVPEGPPDERVGHWD